MKLDIQALLDYFRLETLPVEGTFYKQTYRSEKTGENGKPVGTAMIGISHANQGQNANIPGKRINSDPRGREHQ